jgi:hypothetical protein
LIAVGDGGAIVASTNSGTNWSSKTSGTTNNLYGVTYGKNVDNAFIAVGTPGTILQLVYPTTVIDVRTEGLGAINDTVHGTTNSNGSMVWDGSEWVVNSTYAHKFYIDVRTGDRLKNVDTITVDGVDDGALYDDGQYRVTRKTYSYSKLAIAGGSYSYNAVEYAIDCTDTPETYGKDNHRIVLRSRGTGNGTANAYFDIYIEDYATGSSTPTVTALRGDPAWFTYPNMTIEQAMAQTSETEYKTGDFPTESAWYFMDIGGGGDLSPAGVGKAYVFHTAPINAPSVSTDNLGSSFPTDFGLRWMDSQGNVHQLQFSPSVLDEIYTPSKPVITPNGGNFTSSTDVSISGFGGDIYYTTDGSDPITSSTRTKYTSAFNLTHTATVKAAVSSGTAWSDIASADFIKEAVLASGVTINEKPVSLQVGDNKQLTVAVAPEDTTDKSITWSVRTETLTDMVLVSDGLLTAKKAGTAVVRATNQASGIYDECTVTVTNPDVIRNVIVDPLSHTEGTNQTIQINTTLFDNDIFESLGQEVSTSFKDSGGVVLSKTVKDSRFNSSIEQTITVSETATAGDYQVLVEVLLYDQSDQNFSDTQTIKYVINKKTQPNSGNGSTSGGNSSSKTPVVEVKSETVTPPITDINNHWAHDCIAALLQYGEIAGYPDHTIKPDREITRAEAANLVVAALGNKSYQLKSKDNPYKDKLPFWAENAILKATENGFMKGYPDGTFRADNTITRAEMCVMLMRAFPKQTNTISALTFEDKSEIPGWARDSVEKALSSKAITGYSDNTFRSQAYITRAEAFTIICKLKGYHQEHVSKN